MDSDKKVWKLTGFMLLLFAFAFTAFPFSIYLGKGTKDPDYYEVLGWFASLGFLFSAIILGVITLRLWLYKRSEMSKIVEDYKFSMI